MSDLVNPNRYVLETLARHRAELFDLLSSLIESNDHSVYFIINSLIETLSNSIVQVYQSSNSNDEGCPMESDTCGMDTTPLSADKNLELMKHGLEGLDGLL